MYIKSGPLSGQCKRIKNDIKVTTQEHIYGKKKRNKNKMCKTIDVQKTKRKKNCVLGLNK